MSAAVVVGLLLAVGEPRTATGKALIDSATAALGPGVSLVVRQVRAPTDDEALQIEGTLGAAAVAVVSWDIKSPRADLRIHLARSDRWISRRLDFQPSDLPSERGRTVGFALASMLLSETDAKAAPESKTDDHVPHGASPVGVPTDQASAPAVARPPPEPAAIPSGQPQPTASEGPASTSTSTSLGFAALGSVGVGGPASGVGLSIDADHRISRAFLLRVGVSMRTGDLPGLNGNDRVLVGSAGAAWSPVAGTPAQPLSVDASLEAALLYHDFSHQRFDGSDVHQGRLIPGVVAKINGTWRVSTLVDVLVGVSPEVALGTTQVFVAGQLVAMVPAVRLQARFGIRVRVW